MSKYDIKTLYANIGKLITSSIEFSDIVKGIMHEVQMYFQPENWSLMRYDKITGYLYFTIIEGIDSKFVERVKIRPGEGVAGYVAVNREPLFVRDTSQDPRFCDKVDKVTGFETRSIIAVPCVYREKLYGVIEIVNHAEMDSFTEEDMLILNTIADFSAIAFENAELYQNAIMQSQTDPMTGLFNHSKLSDYIGEVMSESPHRRMSDSGEIVVFFIDLNNFKNINDEFGHAEGDRVLKYVAGELQNIFRKEDLLVRMGGDEFAAIVKCKSSNAVQIETNISKRLDSLRCSSEEYGYSVGLAYGTSRGSVSEIKNLIHNADLKMYENKKDSKVK